MPAALIDLFCNDLEVAQSVTMNEVGPASAFLEHGSPMPVGAELSIQTDSGDRVSAVVTRVHEDTGEGSHPAGMFVSISKLAGSAEAWWASHLDVDVDPEFPPRTQAVTAARTSGRTSTLDMTAEELAMITAEEQTAASAAAPVPGPPPRDEAAPNARKDAAARENETVSDVKATIRMSSAQVREITDTAATKTRNGTSIGMAVAEEPDEDDEEDGESADGNGSSKRKRKRKKKK